MENTNVPNLFSNYTLSFTIQNNNFTNCTSKYEGGGAIFLNPNGEFNEGSYFDDILLKNFFLNNTALFGNNIATSPSYIEYNSNNMDYNFTLIVFKNVPFIINFEIFDYFGNRIQFTNESTLPQIELTSNTYISTPYIKNTSPINIYGNLSFQGISQNGNSSNL